MATRYRKNIPSDSFINIITDTDPNLDPPFVVGQRYNAQAVGPYACTIIEAADQPSVNDTGTFAAAGSDSIPFVLASGLGIWVRSNGGLGTMVFNDDEA